MMLMVIIGGAGKLFGPVLGAVVVILLELIASIYTPERWPLILGGVFVICVLFVRGGFAVYLSRFWRKVGPKYGSTKG
jgi:branched-chain amino acid transport system permease protein